VARCSTIVEGWAPSARTLTVQLGEKPQIVDVLRPGLVASVQEPLAGGCQAGHLATGEASDLLK